MSDRTPGQEIVKQLIDQPLHFLWAGASGFLPFLVDFLIGLPAISLSTEFWAVLGATTVSVISVVAIIVREWRQWPSDRWWDPPLDWFFFAAGLATGIVLGLTVL